MNYSHVFVVSIMATFSTLEANFFLKDSNNPAKVKQKPRLAGTKGKSGMGYLEMSVDRILVSEEM